MNMLRYHHRHHFLILSYCCWLFVSYNYNKFHAAAFRSKFGFSPKQKLCSGGSPPIPAPAAMKTTDSSFATRSNLHKPRQPTIYQADVSNASLTLAPFVVSFLFRSVHDVTSDNNGNDPEATYLGRNQSFFQFSDACNAILGLQIWDLALRHGRLPMPDDFQTKYRPLWPAEPLFSEVCRVVSSLALPRFVRRHPQVLPSVLLAISKVVVEFVNTGRFNVESGLSPSESGWEKDDDDDDDDDFIIPYENTLSQDELKLLAGSIAEKISQEWATVVQGCSLLDAIFGYNHNMLDTSGETGFGLHDGVWEHKGWNFVPELQEKISSMPELREFLSSLGRRPSVRGKTRRFLPRKISYSSEDSMGVHLDRSNPTSVAGICYSGNLSSMLPSEAVYLLSSFKTLRLLFLAKKAESKLISYDRSDWSDVNTLPLPRKGRRETLPSSVGGPLIICLDTSWSMSGLRESLAKAVVLASVTVASLQGRECRVVSFSSANNVMECGILSCDVDGVKKLLDFLSYSFGGGTDVTGALNYAIDTFEHEMELSDLILVTDGELPNPPVSKLVLTKLERLREKYGVEIHGLLVGKNDSPALSTLCTQVHDFLYGYENLILDDTVGVTSKESFSSATLPSSPRRRMNNWSPISKGLNSAKLVGSRLPSCLRAFVGDIDEFSMKSTSLQHGTLLGRKSIIPTTKRRRFIDDNDDDEWDSDLTSDYGSKSFSSGDSVGSNFVQRLESAYETLQNGVIHDSNKWSREELDTEIGQSSIWSKRHILLDSISYVKSGLVERDAEAILVVVGMVSQEHVLFIGPPGTSKSELGRRLSQLCGGPFFQRLFTRFTTPEEIFGPLSLRALECDKYVRCIDGFLPTATVAFLDEVFKANSSVLNTLLTILNERQFDNGPGDRVICPLKCVIGASNELPDTEELDALLDRFLLRAQVMPVSDAGLLQILSESSSIEALPCTEVSGDLELLVTEISATLPTIHLGQNICILIQKLRTFVRDELGVYVSDRRLVKASRLLRLSAASNGRSAVDLVDCLLLENVLWQLPEQQVAIREWLLDNLTPGDEVVKQSRFLLTRLASEAFMLVEKTMGDITGENGARKDDVEAILSVRQEIEQIENLLQEHSRVVERHAVLVETLSDHLWLSGNNAQAAKEFLTPLALAAIEATDVVLAEATELKLSLSDDIENDLRSSVIEMLINDDTNDCSFTEDELEMSMKEAKRKYDGDKLRKWKRARKNIK